MNRPPASDSRRMIGDNTVPLRVLLFALLGGIVAWLGHFNLVYLLNTLACTEGWGAVGGADGIPLGDILVYAVTPPFAAVSAASGVVALRRRARLSTSTENETYDTQGAERSLLLLGALSAVLFTLLIVMEAFAPVGVPTCSELHP